jgi:hypothetical protein
VSGAVGRRNREPMKPACRRVWGPRRDALLRRARWRMGGNPSLGRMGFVAPAQDCSKGQVATTCTPLGPPTSCFSSRVPIASVFMRNLMKFAPRRLVQTPLRGLVPNPSATPVQSPAALAGDVLGSGRLLVVPVLLLCLTFCAHAQTWSGVLGTSRGTDWSQAGIPGGIPSGSWTQCGPTIGAYGSSSSPASPATIVSALNACGANQYVLLGPGTFYLSTGFFVTGLNNVELRGSGTSSTTLKFYGAASGGNFYGEPVGIGFQSSDSTYPGGPGTVLNWTAGYGKGSNTVTVSSGANIVANSTLIVLDACDTGYSGSGTCAGSATDNGNFFVCEDAYSSGTGCSNNGSDGFDRPHRGQVEVVQATSCSPACGSAGSTVVTINVPLIHPNWAALNNPQAYLIQAVSNDGVRALTMDMSPDVASGTNNFAGIGFNNTANSWVYQVAILHPANMGVWHPMNFRFQMEQSYVFDAGQALRYADPVGEKGFGESDLIQNNIFQAERPFIQSEGPMTGSVIAYNFCINSYTGNDFYFEGLLDHATGDDLNLWEGNACGQFAMDVIHGTHLMETSFRNFLTGWESCNGDGNCGSNTAKDSGLGPYYQLAYQRYGNAVANVLGTPGVTTAGYTCINASEFNCNNYVWNLGSGNSNVPPDVLVTVTQMREGNWDTFNNSAQFNPSEYGSAAPVYPGLTSPSTTFPASFYLSSKPAWFGSIPWPAIGPDVSGGNVGQCTGTVNTPGQFAGVAAISSSQCTGSALGSAWAGHVNAIPAMACYLNHMNGPPDGSGSALPFNPQACYSTGGGSSQSAAPNPPTNLQVIVQ